MSPNMNMTSTYNEQNNREALWLYHNTCIYVLNNLEDYTDYSFLGICC